MDLRPRRWLDLVLIRTPRGVDPALRLARPWLAAASSLSLPAEMLRGRAADGTACSAVVIGGGALAGRLVRSLFANAPACEPLPPVSLLDAPRRLATCLDTADLVFATVPRPLAAWVAGPRMLRVPTVVEFMIDASAATDLSGASRSLRRSARRLAEVGFTTRLSPGPAELESFYYDFYRPMLARRFGGGGSPLSMLTLGRRLRAGGLIWLEHDGRTIGGAALEVRGDTLRLLVSVERPTGRPDLERWIQFAVTRAGMALGRQRGCRTIDLGAAQPVLGDGVFARKRAFGATVRARASATHELLIGWPSGTPAVRAWLGRSPLVVRDGKRLAALTAVDEATPADPRAAVRLHRALLPAGIVRLTVLSGAGWQPSTRDEGCPGSDALHLTGPLGAAELVALGCGRS
ncbi:MAG: GNAT family N-acetyltransferase [Geminicoccaceae bacterium]|nr:GNAT family N-acetyltransferase [Geminicoccaceae bacterium]